MCWLQTSAFHTCCHANAYFALLNVILPGDHFLPCLLTITGSFFGAKHGYLKTDTSGMRIIANSPHTI